MNYKPVKVILTAFNPCLPSSDLHNSQRKMITFRFILILYVMPKPIKCLVGHGHSQRLWPTCLTLPNLSICWDT